MDLWLFITTFAKWIASAIRRERTLISSSSFNYYEIFPPTSLEVFRFVCFITQNAKVYLSVVLPPLLVSPTLRNLRVNSNKVKLPLDILLDRHSIVISFHHDSSDYYHFKVSISDDHLKITDILTQICDCEVRRLNVCAVDRLLQESMLSCAPSIPGYHQNIQESIVSCQSASGLIRYHHMMNILVSHWNYDIPNLLGKAELETLRDFDVYESDSSWISDHHLSHQRLFSTFTMPSIVGWLISSTRHLNDMRERNFLHQRDEEEPASAEATEHESHTSNSDIYGDYAM